MRLTSPFAPRCRPNPNKSAGLLFLPTRIVGKIWKGDEMSKLLSAALAAGLVVAASSAVYARGGGNGGGFGASGYAPGHSFRSYGPVSGYPGASGYAPGRMKKLYGPVYGHPGASGYAPGHRFK